MKKRFIFITARRKELRGGNMKKRRLMLCSIISLIMVFVMAVPMTVSADTVTDAGDATALANAITAAKDGETIKLTAPITASITIPAGKKITLDLNGQTLTNEAGNHTITNEGTLTIKGDGTVDNVSHGRGALVNKGTATINGGTFTRSQEKGDSPSNSGGNSWYVIDNQGTLTVTGGTVKNTSGFSSLVRNMNGTLNVNGGNFSNEFIALKNDDNGIMKITAGTIESKEQAVQNWHNLDVTGGTFNGDVYTWSYDNSQGTATIGGSAVIDGNVAAIQYGNATAKSTVEIKGGTITGTIEKGEYGNAYNRVDPSAATSIITVSGGTFAKEPASAFIPKDKIAIKYVEANSDGKYYVGTNGEIQEIVDNAKSGDIIDVIHGKADLTLTKPGVTIGNNGAEVVVNGQPLTNGNTTVIKEVDPTKPSQDQTQKPSDTAKADKSAKTGDDFNLFAVGGVALAAIIAMAAVAITGRRHRQR